MKKVPKGRYTKEFREEAVKLVTEEGLSLPEAGLRLSLPSSTIRNWVLAFKAGKLGDLIKGAYQIVERKRYRERYKEISGRDPMICRYCGAEMDVYRRWHPKYGVIYDELDEIKTGRYEPLDEIKSEEAAPVYSSVRFQQLSWFPFPA